jgi:hypothetical protein
MEILQSEGHEKTMYASTKKGKAKNSKQQAAIAIAKKEKDLDEYGTMMASTKRRKKKKASVYSMAAEESPAEDKMDGGYKAKFQAMLKKSGKSLKDMSDEEKKKFFNAVDASHSAKDESVNEEDIKEYITAKQVKMAKGIAFDKRHKGGDMTGAAKKMEKIKKGLSNHPGAKKALRIANEEDESQEMDPKKHVKKEDDKYCVFNKDGEKVKSFDSKDEAEAYAVKNHKDLMELKMHPQHGSIKKYAKAKASDTFKRTFGAVGDGGPEGDTSKARAAGKKVLRKLKKPLAKTGMAKAANKAAKKSSDRMTDLTRQDSGSSEPVKKMSNKQRKDQMKTGMYPDANDKEYRKNVEEVEMSKMNKEDANSDSIEKQQVMNRKMKRKSDSNARKEKETDQGFKAAMKESLIDKVVEKLGEDSFSEGAFKRMATDKAEKERLADKRLATAMKVRKINQENPPMSRDKFGRSNKKYFHPSEDAQSDARRDAKMDSRGLAKTKKDKPDMQHAGKKAGDEKDGGHIVMQLRKAVSINKPVKFKDGKSHNVSKADAHKYLNKYMQAKKPADKEKMHGAHDSHDAFKKHL